MPTRILREGIITSETVNSLCPQSELFYRRLMSVLDDYGRYFAHASLLRAACYPLQLDRISEADVQRMLSECVAAGLVILYGGKYLQCQNFRQQTRSDSKFPEPAQGELLIKCKAIAKQMRSESESESESYAKSETETGPVAPRNGVFKKPEPLEVVLYCSKIGLPQSEAEEFMAHYESNGWRVGRNPMRNWRAAMLKWKLTWQKGTYEKQQQSNKRNPTENTRNVGIIRGPTDYAAAAARKLERDGAEREKATVAGQVALNATPPPKTASLG